MLAQRPRMDAHTNAVRKRHVVVVEDNAALAATYRELLEIQGYDVGVFPNGAEALKHVMIHPTDGVVCDLQTPRLEGDLFYATIERAQPPLARRFVFVTGMADDERFREFVAHVHVPVLRKPVPVAALLAEVARVMTL
jgi:CheY-like chemotaxis protein